ncbi:MAG: site-specific integrase [Acidimicrobiia bacterium]|nr:site-specific integrase [Acidimicrobiia bacterium]MDH5289644.1 site-specific integrase [Acidimicrobiia bacterium]
MGTELRKAPGMRERSPGVWELIVQAGRDPVTGRYRQVSRTFRGSLREAKQARAQLVVDAAQGRHDGTGATVDDLCRAWLLELERKGRSPNTIHNYRKTYRHDIEPTLGRTPVNKVTTKMLTDLYGEHQRRGLAPRSVYQIHATMSSMMTQACRWGWRSSNPAQWAEPPSLPNHAPTVPTPAEIVALIDAAQASRRPEYGRLIFVAATTGLRRAELCALRRQRDIDWDRRIVTVAHSIIEPGGRSPAEAPTKNRQTRQVAIDERTAGMLTAQVEFMRARAEAALVELHPDAFLFSDAVDGTEPWRPGAITLYFTRLRKRAGLNHLTFHSLRKFMGTYGQDLGFSPVQVAMRAGHDPSVAAKHYTGNIAQADRALADAVSALLTVDSADE